MASRVFWRRSATAAWVYAAVVFGILGTVVAARVLGLEDFGIYVTALAAVGFFQVLLDLTVEEPLTKFGFRYIVSEEWGKLRRLFVRALQIKFAGGVLAALALVAPRARRRHDLRRRGARGSDSRRRAHAPRAGDGERRRDGAPAARALRPAGRVSDVRHGPAPRRDRDRALRTASPRRSRRWSSRRRSRRSRSRSSAWLPSAAFPPRPRARSVTDRREVISFTLASSVGHRGRLAADDARAARARHRRGPDAGRSLPHRPDAADRPLRGKLTCAPRPPHRPDARLGARQARRACSRACARTRSSPSA